MHSLLIKLFDKKVFHLSFESVKKTKLYFIEHFLRYFPSVESF